MKGIRLFSIFFFLVINNVTFGQTIQSIDSLQNEHQKCLDKGEGMMSCAQHFYCQMDTMLNVVYNKLKKTCDQQQKENLTDDELTWLAERDVYFRKKEAEVNNPSQQLGVGAMDSRMVMYDDKASFVKERVKELISKRNIDYSNHNYKVIPTGSYELNEVNIDGYGYTGNMCAKILSNSRVAIHFFICKGLPSYNNGTIQDTILIKDNIAVYTISQSDSSCKVIFTFFKRGVKVEEKTADYNWGCGFGHAVVANAFFKKKNNLIPTDKQLDPEN